MIDKKRPGKKNIIEKYLDNYADSLQLPHDLINKQYDYVLVIPAYREQWSCLTNVWQNVSHSNILIVLVINSPVASDTQTLKLKHDALNEADTIANYENCEWLNFSTHPDVLLIDRCTQPINEKQGVGLARKIGSDLALQLISLETIRVPWIFSTDADARLPTDYFSAPRLSQSDAAIIYPFNHRPIEGHTASCQIYEITLLYYIAGLNFAGSGYAHSSIGSTLSINATDYAKVRGYPKRSAGEDFYLLNKLIKIAPFNTDALPYIALSGRLSNRVPFGTGPGISAVEKHADPLTEHLFYNPAVFDHLRVFLQELSTCQSSGNLTNHFSSPLTQQWCAETGFTTELLKHQPQSAKVFRKFIFDWFDGFRTLKYIHYIRDENFGSVPLHHCFDDTVLPKKLLNKPLEEIIHFLQTQLFDKPPQPPYS